MSKKAAHDEVRKEMHRLKRWLGKERARHVRFIEDAPGTLMVAKERSRSHVESLDFVMNKIDADLRKRAERNGGAR